MAKNASKTVKKNALPKKTKTMTKAATRKAAPAKAAKPRALTPTQLHRAADAASRFIPPVWPLATSVAVNPYLGQAEENLAQAGARLARVGGVPVTMPRAWYRGRVSDDDLKTALAASNEPKKPRNLAALKSAMAEDRVAENALPTIADLASNASGDDWTELFAERFGAWAAGYFDQGQALWAAPTGDSAWAAYTAHATHDLTPEIMGLTGFAAFVSAAPKDPILAIGRAVKVLNLPPEAMETYFHQLLFTLGGWGQVARYKLWKAELAGDADRTIIDLLAIRLIWEEALFLQHRDAIAADWLDVARAHAAPVEASADDAVDAILQQAVEMTDQSDLATTLENASGAVPKTDRPAVQAAFCIDVRSEVFRRALEAADARIQTLGFAGFFGVATKHSAFASDVEELRLPVLLNPGITSSSTAKEQEADDRHTRYEARAKRAWGRFRLAAVSSFAFVEAMGPVYGGRLLRDALGFGKKSKDKAPKPHFEPMPDVEGRVTAAETVLRAMSLTENFAPIIMLAGHGANVVNNPHASALHCGACGGYSGEVNARLLAALLNDPATREALVRRGITVPDDTLFLAALHDTTTDAVTLYDGDLSLSAAQQDAVDQLAQWLAEAGQTARAERALLLPQAESGDAIAARATDWAQVRPEWALAGCKAFIAAPRARTAGCDLGGRAFLHDYDWKADGEHNGFATLELIMTAPVVVASWISLQYYGSSVSPAAFGGGNKLLHNVVGGIGVVEGNGGALRAGLPWQSVHDGEKLRHDPLRLSVCIEAPRKEMDAILKRHPGVQALFDNGWLHLFALEEGKITHRSTPGRKWEVFTASA